MCVRIIYWSKTGITESRLTRNECHVYHSLFFMPGAKRLNRYIIVHENFGSTIASERSKFHEFLFLCVGWKWVYKISWLVRELWLVNTRVWIRVSKHRKFPAKSVLKFVLLVSFTILWKKYVTAFVCLNTVIQRLGVLLDF